VTEIPATPEPNDGYSGATWNNVRKSARNTNYDWYVAALLSPRRARFNLMTLAAFAGEVARIPGLVREPMMGEIRLQWWRDALERPAFEPTGNPVADALRQVMASRKLPVGLLVGIIDAHEAELKPDGLADQNALDHHFIKSYGAQIALAARVLETHNNRSALQDLPDIGIFPSLAATAGRAYGHAMLAANLARSYRGGVEPLPTDRLNRSRAEARDALFTLQGEALTIGKHLRPALLPVALVGFYLQASEHHMSGDAKSNYGARYEVSELSKTWRMLMAYWLGRV